MSLRNLKSVFITRLSIFAIVAVCCISLAAQTGGTRLLRTPTVSATQIAFAYAQNIWVVPRAGGSAIRLTSFSRADIESSFFAGWQMDSVYR